MNVEENRLRTFTDWPTNASVDAARIAKAGFYYSGRAMEVQCFLCGTTISDWNYGDQAMARHRQADPNCPFVVNPANTCNVPLLPPSANNGTGGERHLPSSSSSSGARLTSEDVLDTTSPVSSSSLESSIVRNNDVRQEYRTFLQRLRSFANWPIPSVVSPERLAKAGFYYLQQADMVECAFCKGVVMKWEPGDDPDREHRIHFPNCDFYIHQDADEERLELPNVKLLPGTSNDLKELGIQAHTAPRKPKHATYERRLQTFQGWPENMKQTPEMLASAGFYYNGTGDHVRCFHCDGGLHNWDATDDAWTEHARWFPKCGFVNLVRGQEFVKRCIANRPPLDPSILKGVPDDDSGDVSETPPASLSTVLPPTQTVTDAMLEGLLNTGPAMAALEIGLHEGRVKRALKRRMEQIGLPYTNADQLIEDVLHDQFMDENRIDTQTPESPSAELINLLSQVISSQSGNSSAVLSNNVENCAIYPEKMEETKVESMEQQNMENAEVPTKENGYVDKAKPKLNEAAASLEEENRRLKEARLCKICMDREVAVVFLPCGHLATCVHCAPSLIYCPMCRQEIRATVRTFLS